MFNFDKILNRNRKTEEKSPTFSKSSDDGDDSDPCEGFICPTCRAAFPTGDELKNHFESEHNSGGPSAEKNLLTCPNCRSKFKTEFQLLAHNSDQHESEEAKALKVRVEYLTEQRKLLQHDLEQATSVSADVRKERDRLYKDLREQTTVLEQCRGEVNSYSSRAANAESCLQEAEEKIFHLQTAIAQGPSTDDIDVLKDEIVRIQRMMDDALSLKNEQMERLSKKSMEYLDSLEQMAKNHMEAELTIKELETKLATLECNLTASEDKNSNNRNRIRILQNDLEELKTENECKENEVNNFKRMLSEREKEINTLKSDLKELKVELQQQKMERSKLIMKIEEGGGANTAIAQLKEENNRLQERLSHEETAHQTEVSAVQSELENIQIEYYKVKHELDTSCRKNNKLESKLPELREELQSIATRCNTLTKEIEVKRKCFNEMYTKLKGGVDECKIENDSVKAALNEAYDFIQCLELHHDSLLKCAADAELPKISSESLRTRASGLYQLLTRVKDELVKKDERSNAAEIELLEYKKQLLSKTEDLSERLEKAISEAQEAKQTAVDAKIKVQETETRRRDCVEKLQHAEEKEQEYRHKIIDMKSDMEILEKTKAELIQKVKDLEKNAKSLASSIYSLEAEKVVCEKKLKACELYSNEKTALAETLQVSLDEMTTQYETARMERGRAETLMADKVLEFQVKHAPYIRSLEAELASIGHELESREKSLDEKSVLVKSFETSLETMSEMYKTTEEEKDRLAKDLLAAKQLLVNNNVKYDKRVEKLKGEHSKEAAALNKEVTHLMNKKRELESANSHLSSKVDATELSHQHKQQEWDERVSHYAAQISVLSENVDTLKDDLQSERARREQAEQKLDEISGAKLELDAKLENALEERKALLDRCLKSETENEKLLQNNADLRRKHDDSVAALQELGRENQALQVENLKHLGRKWTDDNEVAHCTSCGKAFSVTVRKHHCRNCGSIFCNDCSSKTAAVASSKKPVRVCDVCYGELTK